MLKFNAKAQGCKGAKKNTCEWFVIFGLYYYG